MSRNSQRQGFWSWVLGRGEPPVEPLFPVRAPVAEPPDIPPPPPRLVDVTPTPPSMPPEAPAEIARPEPPAAETEPVEHVFAEPVAREIERVETPSAVTPPADIPPDAAPPEAMVADTVAPAPDPMVAATERDISPPPELDSESPPTPVEEPIDIDEARHVLDEMKRLTAIGRPQGALTLCEDYFSRRQSFRDAYRHPVYLKESLRLCLALDRLPEARDFAERLRARVPPDDPCAEVLLARHFTAKGDRDAARSEWRAVLARQGHNAEALKWLAADGARAGEIGGLAEIAWHDHDSLATFARGDRDERLTMFAPLAPPDGPPLHDPDSLPEAVRASYASGAKVPGGVVYAVRDCILTGPGLLMRGSTFVYEPDIFPGYFRHAMSTAPHGFDDRSIGMAGRADGKRLHVETPIAVVLHPNTIWGHFLVEMLPRLYLLGVLARLGRSFPVAVPVDAPEWVKAFVALYTAPENIVSYDPRTQFVSAPAMIVPSMMQADWRLSPAFNLLVSDLMARCGIAEAVVPDGPRRIYLSRARFRGAQRLLNEAEVETTLGDLGFTVVHPQELSLADQVRLFHGAEAIAGEYNSALHSALFARPGTRVIGLNCHNHLQAWIGRVRGHVMAFVPPSDGAWRDAATRGEQRHFSVDPAAVRRVVDQLLPPAN